MQKKCDKYTHKKHQRQTKIPISLWRMAHRKGDTGISNYWRKRGELEIPEIAAHELLKVAVSGECMRTLRRITRI